MTNNQLEKLYEGVIENVYKSLDYTLDEEVKRILTSKAQHILISAPAGGTKTTMTQFIVTMLKLRKLISGTREQKIAKEAGKNMRIPTTIPRTSILCLVYNKHNSSDIETVQNRFYNLLTSLKLFSGNTVAANYVEPGVKASTLHSFAYEIVKDNKSLLGLKKFELTSEELLSVHFEQIVKSNFKGSSMEKECVSLISDLKSLYQLYVNLMLYETDPETPLVSNPEFEIAMSATSVPLKYVRPIFEAYDKRKKMFGMFEFSDMLRRANEALNHEIVRDSYHLRLDIIVADEVQDFTPLMLQIFKKLIGPETLTISVGDPDQRIYSFMGADPDSMGNFTERIGVDNIEFHNLSINRRCYSDTMPFAMNVIESINSRAPREITTTKSGGELNRVLIKSPEELLRSVMDVLNNNLDGTKGIMFKKKTQSILLSRYLYVNKIPVNFINANNCMQHKFYTLFIKSLTEVFIYKSHKGLAQLSRFLPISKDKIEEFFDFDEKGISRTVKNSASWPKLDFRPLYENSPRFVSIDEQFNKIKEVAKEVNSSPTSDYIPILVDFFYKNYYSFLPGAKDDPIILLVLDWIKEDLSTGYSIEVALRLLSQSKERMFGSGRNLGKVNITTMHGSKGLEFDHTVVYLEDDPTPPGVVLSAQAVQSLDEEESRLIYVAATRHKKSITVVCNLSAPHKFSHESYFKRDVEVIKEAKFTDNVSVAVSDVFDTVIPETTRVTRRRRMALED